jgi:hypothetical protein
VTGSGPQLNVMTPPFATAATTASPVQVAAAPVPMTVVGFDASSACPAGGTGALAPGLPAGGPPPPLDALPLEEPDEDDPAPPPLLDALPLEEPDEDDPAPPLPLDALPLEEPDDEPGGVLVPLPEPQPARVASPTNPKRTAQDSNPILEGYRAA